MSNPIISIVLSVYNAEKYLLKCLQSMKNQTYTNWELVIINDGSTDSSHQIIKDFIQNLPNKVQYLHLQQNKGLPYCLNLGIQHAKGIYIARIDADDIMFENRLQKQVHFLEKYPAVGVLGSYAIDINELGNPINLFKVAEQDPFLKQNLFASCPFIHPSVMIRKYLLTNGMEYRNKYRYAEDYDLWIRLADKTQFANLPEPLIKKRVHNQQITFSKKGHYDTLHVKFDHFVATKTLFQNHWYLWKHILVLLLPSWFYQPVKRWIKRVI
jgi:glycosyltransferase involved in cell wall biosynthesis